MKIITSITTLQHELANYTQEQIALVPTMGCLHEGHLSLIRKAKRLADIVVVSIYVNPLQFGKNEDLDGYPTPFTEDVRLCECEDVDFIFHPQSLYPEAGIQVGLYVNSLSQKLCGALRQGHFDGVVTVVNILFNIVRPNIAIFGSKDFQQLLIIRSMVADLHMPVEIIAGDTVREADGLAKSSRNRYLSPTERKQAAAISACLHVMRKTAQHNHNLAAILEIGHNYLQDHHIQAEYLEICNELSLEPIRAIEMDKPARIFIAALVGSARLIDNMPLSITQNDKETSTCA